MKTLHALFVGINEYQNIDGLNAAVLDCNRVRDYFQQIAAKNFKPKFSTLLDTQATKANIVSEFEKQFIKSSPDEGDVFLFYYSGHGGQEKAHDAFEESEIDRKLENLACHDADPTNGKGFLADKELRWLVRQAEKKGIHFLMISDSCHSGDNTRGYIVEKPPKAKKRLAHLSEKRAWSDFIFGKKISEADFKTKNIEDILPQGKHVSISACQSMESAYEVFDGGIFTSGLLKFLDKSKGDISYFDLKTQLKNYVSSQYIDQSPQIYSVGDENQMFKTFLGGAIKDKPVFANVFYNFNERRWELDMGGIYGVTEEWNGAKQQVIVTNHNDEQLTAYITEVSPTGAVIRFEPYSNVKKSEHYRAFVPSAMTRRMNILLTGETEGIDLIKNAIPADKLEKSGITWCDDSSNPDYALRAVDGDFYITLPDDARPLTEQEEGYRPASAEKVFKKLEAIGKWSFVKNLKNKKSSLLENDFKLEISENGKPVKTDGNLVELNVSPPKFSTDIKIKLTNEVGQQLYVGMVYLSSLFGMSPNLIQGQVKPANSGEFVWASAGRPISISLEKYIRDFDWSHETFYVQIIWATTEFGMELFVAKDLDAPRANKKSASTRGMGGIQTGPDWQTRLIEFRVKNPEVS